ncbi:MAG: hypothetical protein FWB91_03740 [Defluviitaleaceae bacterium]|nr:hypothetical protein [Defluviitaleaceae bacterium]
MSAFEMQDTIATEAQPVGCTEYDRRRVKDECIVAHKVYDSCRRQNCLTPRELGPAREANHRPHDEMDFEGDDTERGRDDIIVPPHGAASVTMDKVEIKKIQVVDKQPSPFRAGFWDVDVKYVFEYRLTFREAGGRVISHKQANSVFNMKATLFGSVGGDLVIGTDLYRESDGTTFSAAPFIWVEAKALGLDAKIDRHHGNSEVHVTIGLFSILKLIRLVHLNVQSKGFCIPHECEDQGNINPCEYFADLDFPMDIFAPPQRKEFHDGVSENIRPVYAK